MPHNILAFRITIIRLHLFIPHGLPHEACATVGVGPVQKIPTNACHAPGQWLTGRETSGHEYSLAIPIRSTSNRHCKSLLTPGGENSLRGQAGSGDPLVSGRKNAAIIPTT